MDQPNLSIFKNPISLHIIPFLNTTFFSKSLAIYWNSTTCAPQDCGNGLIIEYPFWIPGLQESYCGSPEFSIICKDKTPVLKLSGDDYIIKKIFYQNNSVLLADAEVFDQENKCPAPHHNLFLLGTPFSYGPDTTDIYFYYNCSKPYARESYDIPCETKSGAYSFAVFHENGIENCQAWVNSRIWSDSLHELLGMNYTDVLKIGFLLHWIGDDCEKCESSGGHCGSDHGDFICHIGGKSSGRSRPLKMIIGATVPGIGLFTFLLIIFYYKYVKHINVNHELEALVKKFESSTPRRYSYADIKKMTKSFKDELGKGGFGNVYKGYLSDGIAVAVKLLNATKGDGDEFVNEVASISRTSHVNVVSLLGFCLDGRKRALVYEFMSNGSLEKHIKKECSLQMGMEELFKIAIGVARGLEYLHGGMNTRILHFDIKPHNILLDEDFCPKISDFGLAKLCNRKQSFVSMVEARGTIGYIAPEVFNRNFGVVSYKSDVYSYGMMVLEMVGARSKLTTAEMTNSSTAYVPDWVYQRITCNEAQNLQADAMTREGELERKMMIVGLWCIQTNASHRPSMDNVIDMLEGSLEGLVVPPRPLLYSRFISERASLERSILESETTLASSLVSAVGSTHGPKVLPF